MREKALTLSDGSEVRLSTHQIELLGPDERSAAEHFERIRSVRNAVLHWAALTSDLSYQTARTSKFHKSVSIYQYGKSNSWAALKALCQNEAPDEDLSDLKSFLLTEDEASK